MHGVAGNADNSSDATVAGRLPSIDGKQVPASRIGSRGSHLQGNAAAQRQAGYEAQTAIRDTNGEVQQGGSAPVEGKRNDRPADFYHPASVEPLRSVWIPQDTLGLAQREVKDNRAMGIDSSSDNAFMDAKGHVDIDGRPPGMDEF